MSGKPPDSKIKTLTFTLLGKKVEVPQGDLLLRSIQHLYGDRISMGRFCWNNECGNCEVRCRLEGETNDHTIRACMYEAQSGMRITQVPLEFQVIMQKPTAGEGAEADDDQEPRHVEGQTPGSSR